MSAACTILKMMICGSLDVIFIEEQFVVDHNPVDNDGSSPSFQQGINHERLVFVVIITSALDGFFNLRGLELVRLLFVDLAQIFFEFVQGGSEVFGRCVSEKVWNWNSAMFVMVSDNRKTSLPLAK